MKFGNDILAGTTLAREDIRSEGFVSGGVGWRIERDGDAEFNNITARGNIEADRLIAADQDSQLIIDPLQWTGLPSISTVIMEFHHGVPNEERGNITAQKILADDAAPYQLTIGPARISGQARSALTLRSESPDETVAPSLTLTQGGGTHPDGDFNIRQHRVRIFPSTVGDPNISLNPDGSILTTEIQLVADGTILTPAIALNADGTIHASNMRPVESSDATQLDISTTSYVDDGNTGQSFVVPPSGVVKIEWADSLQIQPSGAGTISIFAAIEVRTGGIIGSGTIVHGFDDNDALRISASGGSENKVFQASTFKLITGLTPGNTYNVRIGHRVANTSTGIARSNSRRMLISPQM